MSNWRNLLSWQYISICLLFNNNSVYISFCNPNLMHPHVHFILLNTVAFIQYLYEFSGLTIIYSTLNLESSIQSVNQFKIYLHKYNLKRSSFIYLQQLRYKYFSLELQWFISNCFYWISLSHLIWSYWAQNWFSDTSCCPLMSIELQDMQKPAVKKRNRIEVQFGLLTPSYSACTSSFFVSFTNDPR